MSWNKLSVIIVSFNTKDYLLRCLESLQQNPPSFPMEIIVVDNASEDGSPQAVRDRFPEVKLLEMKENLGFAAATNAGIRESSGDLLLFLNSDTEVTPSALDRTAEKLRDRGVGAVGCQLMYADGSFQLSFGWEKGFFREIADKLAGRVLERYYEAKLRGKEVDMEVDWLSGAFIMTRRDVVERAGMFDESYFLYMEDVDWCLRVRRAGYRIIYTTSARIYHFLGKSTSRRPLAAHLQARRSRIIYYKKHRPTWEIKLLKAYYKILCLFRRAYCSLLSLF